MRLAQSLSHGVVQPLQVRHGPGRKRDGEPEIDLGTLKHLVNHRVRVVEGQLRERERR
jgi:hypothetical protein